MPSSLMLTDGAREMLEDIPGFMADDPTFRAIMQCYAKEAALIEGKILEIRDNGIAFRVTELGASWHERQLGLPVSPPGLSIEQRRGAILAGYQARSSVFGFTWQNDVTALVGGPGWTYTEDPSMATITVYLPWDPSSDSFLRVKKQIIELPSWPAHLELSVQSSGGFILDFSKLDLQQFHP